MGEQKSTWGFGLSFKGLSSLLMGDDLAEELEPLPTPKPAGRSRPRAQSPKRDSEGNSAYTTTKAPRTPRTRSRSPKLRSNNNKRIGDQLRGLKKKEPSESSPAIPVRDSLNSAMARRRSSAGVLSQAPFVPAHPPRSFPESQAADSSVTLTQEQVNAKMKILMNHPVLWAEFKEKLGKHQNANSHGTVRVVMQEFLLEHGDELEDENTLASSPPRKSSLIFNVFAGLTGESSRRLGDEAIMTEMDTYYRTTRNPPSRNNSNSGSRTRIPPRRNNSNSSSRSKGRPSLQKGGFASLSARAMNNLAGEEAPITPIIVSDSDLSTKRERPGLQKGGLESLSARAMNNLAGEEATLGPIKLSDSDMPTRRERTGLQKGGLASLSARAINKLANEEAPVTPIVVSDSDLPTKRNRPGLQKGGLSILSTRAMNSLAAEASIAVGELSPNQSRRLGLSTRAMHSLAGEAEETMEAAAQNPRRHSMGGRSSLSARNLMAAINNNIAGEASPQPTFVSAVSTLETNSNEEPHRSSSWISSVLPTTKGYAQTSVPKPPARSSWSPTHAFTFFSGEVRIPAQPAQTNAQAPPAPPFGSNDDDLQSVDLNRSSHHKNRHAEVPHVPSSGGLVGTLRRVSLLFSHDIQLELEAANRTQAAASALLNEALTTDAISHDIQPELEAANTTQAVASSALMDDEALTSDRSSLFHESEASLESVIEEEEEAEYMLRSSYLIGAKRNNSTRDKAAKHNSISSLSASELSFGETDSIAEMLEEESSSEEHADEGLTGEAGTKGEVLAFVPTLEDRPRAEELL
jgi:hypothetical protein